MGMGNDSNKLSQKLGPISQGKKENEINYQKYMKSNTVKNSTNNSPSSSPTGTG